MDNLPEFEIDDGFAFERCCNVPLDKPVGHVVVPLPENQQQDIDEVEGLQSKFTQPL